ncbi:U21-ctenitoxin-Pn1a-like [Oppia nitens]|uniref:U21-ctenitoxin-Pn1a-like n=1 Tax=Oppia nitens TaxID=1686743 RepID=UPI0023DBCD03|nr:U21-ctenitoxin-Pn1a-like [Oppia nitens]
MLTLLLLSSVLVSFSVCIHSQIKHYPNVTLDTCGIGRQSLLTTTGNCLKWSSNESMDIQNGRPAKPGELPWIVYIEVHIKLSISTLWLKKLSFRGTGTILNKRWIITCAHLLDNDEIESIAVYPAILDKRHKGRPYKVATHLLYPSYGQSSYDYDIGLIKLDEDLPIQTPDTPQSWLPMNGICLPDIGVVNNDKELALLSGFGYLDDDIPNDDFVRIGWTQIMPLMYNSTDREGLFIIAYRFPMDTGAATCKGDSGGPLIQFVSGRAVLIGINILVQLNKTLKYPTCLAKQSDYWMTFIRVSNIIDWISTTAIDN